MKERLKIIEKGNTVKSLAIETEDGLKICSGISLKNVQYAELFCEAPRMFKLLEEFRDDFGISIQSDFDEYYRDKIEEILNGLKLRDGK